jgi:hypothetical protein
MTALWHKWSGKTHIGKTCPQMMIDKPIVDGFHIYIVS